MILYLDTSVLVSCYVSEMHSSVVLEKIAKYPGDLLVSQLAETEFYSALSMKCRMKQLSLIQRKKILESFHFHFEMGQYTKAYLTNETYQLAQHFLLNSSLKLRTLDALHLALAQNLKAELFTADFELAKAAARLQLKCQPIIE